MRMFQAVEQVGQNLDLALEGQTPTSYRSRQAFPVQVLHGEKKLAVDLARLVDGDYQRMLQARRRPAFTAEALGLLTILNFGSYGLESHHSVQSRVVGLVDLPHAA